MGVEMVGINVNQEENGKKIKIKDNPPNLIPGFSPFIYFPEHLTSCQQLFYWAFQGAQHCT